jgi:hypothetical protein
MSLSRVFLAGKHPAAPELSITIYKQVYFDSITGQRPSSISFSRSSHLMYALLISGLPDDLYLNE